MTFQPGQSGNPGGKPKDAINRVDAVLEAIQIKAKLKGQAGVRKWIASLPNETVAGLYARLLPRDSNVAITGQITYDEIIRRLSGLEVPPEPAEDIAAPPSTNGDNGVVP